MSNSEKISFGFSPYPDEAFMFHGLINGKIDLDGYTFNFVQQDIETLNQPDEIGSLDLNSISLHAYAYLGDQYDILSAGARVTTGNGPVLIGRKKLSRDTLQDVKIAVPGKLTSSNLLVRLYAGNDTDTYVVPSRRIIKNVHDGQYDAGVIIDPQLLELEDTDLIPIMDLGTWWQQETRLPLVLGTCAIRSHRDDASTLAHVIRQSIQYGLDNPEEALDFAMEHAHGRSREHLKKFITRYVNELSVDLGSNGRHGIQTLLNRGFQAGIFPEPVNPVIMQAN